MAASTSLERRIDRWARTRLAGTPVRGWQAGLVEFVVFGLKQAWACVFGALMLALLVGTALWYPDDASLHRNDALVLGSVALQVFMIVARLESGRELWVVVLFHVAGTAMELFKTDVGSWSYEGGGVLHLGAVPLYSGFMYAAVGSYMVRVMRLFDLRFTRYPPLAATAVVAAAIYANFFTHHWLPDARYLLVAAVVVLWGRCVMHYRVYRHTLRMPVVIAFALVAFFIWLAENIATAANAWIYPSQADGWHVVPLTKFVAWFLLMIISVVLVTFVYCPSAPDRHGPAGTPLYDVQVTTTHPHLIDAQSLNSRLNEPGIRIIDASVHLWFDAEGAHVDSGRETYAEGHIPGATFIDVTADLSVPTDDDPFAVVPSETFAEVMSAAGIGDEHTIVVYDHVNGIWATRLRWQFALEGRDDVLILDGGLAAWKAAGLPLASGGATYPTSTFTARRRDERIVSTEQVEAAIDDPSVVLINSLPRESFAEGRIPGSVNVPFVELVDDGGRLRDLGELRQIFAAAGVLNPDVTPVTYCGGGIAATAVAFALQGVGRDDVAVYDGSLNAWRSNPDHTFETD